MLRFHLILALWLSAAPSASAQEAWSASSSTAISITGDIITSAKEIRFGNGASLQLAGTDRQGVFRVVRRVNPVLKNGNRLCGKESPTFVVFGRDEGAKNLAKSSSLYLKIYNGDEIPPSSDAVGMDGSGAGFCALFNYARG